MSLSGKKHCAARHRGANRSHQNGNEQQRLEDALLSHDPPLRCKVVVEADRVIIKENDYRTWVLAKKRVAQFTDKLIEKMKPRYETEQRAKANPRDSVQGGQGVPVQ